jgi:hypothetical protein
MKFNIENKRCKMAKENLDKTCNIMKGILAETIDNLTQVVKKSSKQAITAIMEQGTQNVDELLDVCGEKLKEKVKTHAKTQTKKSK